jgi:hypothetical protein
MKHRRTRRILGLACAPAGLSESAKHLQITEETKKNSIWDFPVSSGRCHLWHTREMDVDK